MTILEHEVFSRWLQKQKIDVRTIILTRLLRVANGNFGDVKSVGGGVCELRIFYGPGYRVYYTVRKTEIVFLLCGGDKSSQVKDIKIAKLLAKEIDDGKIS